MGVEKGRSRAIFGTEYLSLGFIFLETSLRLTVRTLGYLDIDIWGFWTSSWNWVKQNFQHPIPNVPQPIHMFYWSLYWQFLISNFDLTVLKCSLILNCFSFIAIKLTIKINGHRKLKERWYSYKSMSPINPMKPFWYMFSQNENMITMSIIIKLLYHKHLKFSQSANNDHLHSKFSM